MIEKQKSTVIEIMGVASLQTEIRDDARAKSYMTRERLLKVARRKDAVEKSKVYKKLCNTLEKQSQTPTSQKSQAKNNDMSGITNRYVKAQVRKIDNMAIQLEESLSKLLLKQHLALQDADKAALKDSLQLLRQCAMDALSKVGDINDLDNE